MGGALPEGPRKGRLVATLKDRSDATKPKESSSRKEEPDFSPAAQPMLPSSPGRKTAGSPQPWPVLPSTALCQAVAWAQQQRIRAPPGPLHLGRRLGPGPRALTAPLTLFSVNLNLGLSGECFPKPKCFSCRPGCPLPAPRQPGPGLQPRPGR